MAWLADEHHPGHLSAERSKASHRAWTRCSRSPRSWGPVALGAVEPWFRPTVGIALDDGVDELDATAAFEVYTQSAAAHTVALAAGDSVRTRHGLVLGTRSTRTAPSLSRIVVPGTADLDPQVRRWAATRHVEVERLAGPRGATGDAVGGGFAAALQNLAEHTDAATARSTAKMMGYPVSQLGPHHGRPPLRTILLVLATVAVATLLAIAPLGSWGGGSARPQPSTSRR